MRTQREEQINMQNEQSVTRLPSKLALIARLLVAAYLIYTVISLGDVWNRYSGGELMLYMGAMALFAIGAIVMSAFSIYDLIRGRYIGGKLDATKEHIEDDLEVKGIEENQVIDATMKEIDTEDVGK